MADRFAEAIRATLNYHDILALPLTAWEVWSYAMTYQSERGENDAKSGCHTPLGGERRDTNYAATLQRLDQMKNEGILDEKNGYWFLSGRRGMYEQRIERLKISEEKMKRVKRVLKIFGALPFVRGVFISGSVAFGNATRTSDVDILVVAESGRIWTVRVLMVLAALVMGKLRAGRLSRAISDKVCLNHFITTASLAMESKSIYNAATYVRLIPVWGGEWLEKLYDANRWIFGIFTNQEAGIKDKGSDTSDTKYEIRHMVFQHHAYSESEVMRLMQRVLEKPLKDGFGSGVERIARWLQRSFITRNELNKTGTGRVVAKDTELAFHPESPERVILDKFGSLMLK